MRPQNSSASIVYREGDYIDADCPPLRMCLRLSENSDESASRGVVQMYFEHFSNSY
jgi:hypothetical protein